MKAIIKTLLPLLACLVFLVGCEEGEVTYKLEKFLPILEDAAQEGQITWELNHDTKINAYCHWQEHKIVFTQGFIDAVEKGQISWDQALFVVCHEIGHLNPHGHGNDNGATTDTHHDEEFADYYGLLLLDELNTDNHLGIDLYHAIELMFNMGGNHDQDDGRHYSHNVRYNYLKKRLDYWKAHEGEVE